MIQGLALQLEPLPITVADQDATHLQPVECLTDRCCSWLHPDRMLLLGEQVTDSAATLYYVMTCVLAGDVMMYSRPRKKKLSL